MKDIWLALWFFVPAGLANVMPVFANKIPLLKDWNTPLDFGLSWRDKRLLGENKRWRGIISGVVLAVIVIGLQRLWFEHSAWIQSISYVNYRDNLIWLLGALLGMGALLGDAVESFFKRRASVPPGKSWFPFDQLDYIIGGLLLAAIVVRLTFFEYLWILIVWFAMHLLVNYIGFLLHLKDHPI